MKDPEWRDPEMQLIRQLVPTGNLPAVAEAGEVEG